MHDVKTRHEDAPILRAALQPAQFMGWNGATDLMRMLVQGLTADPSRFGQVCLLSAEPWGSRTAAALGVHSKRMKALAALLKDAGTGQARIKFVPFPKRRLPQVLAKRDIDLFITPNNLGHGFPKPWACYLYDFQHKHYPEYFSEEDKANRDRHFQAVFHDAPMVMGESRAFAADAARFYPEYAHKVRVVPFSPLLREAWLTYDSGDAKKKYRIDKTYFIICNQFWVHKDHATAFLALRKLLDGLSNQDILLVCTGAMDDYRRPDYIPFLRNMLEELNLTQHVRLLGHIPKQDQIALLRGAKAVIQPTLFEGSPVAGSGYEAISLGVPLIASNIDVNLEVEDESHVSFFPARDAEALAREMHAALDRIVTPSIANLTHKSNARRERLCCFLWRSGVELREQATRGG